MSRFACSLTFQFWLNSDMIRFIQSKPLIVPASDFVTSFWCKVFLLATPGDDIPDPVDVFERPICGPDLVSIFRVVIFWCVLSDDLSNYVETVTCRIPVRLRIAVQKFYFFVWKSPASCGQSSAKRSRKLPVHTANHSSISWVVCGESQSTCWA